MKEYWVLGGQFDSTDFNIEKEKESLQRFGPYQSYDEAKVQWQKLAWDTVDDALSHFTIRTSERYESEHYWVVGGCYENSDFNACAQEQSYGPYEQYDEAYKKWQQLSWENVDDANARFRIEKIAPEQNAALEDNKTLLGYRLLTGDTSRTFCEKVSKALEEGYQLYGNPVLCWDGQQIMTAQAVVFANKPESERV